MELETKLPVPDREARRVIEDNFLKIQEAINGFQDQIDKLNERVGTLEGQVKQLQENDKDHEEWLKKIEQLLFGSEIITVTDPTDDIRASQSATEISDTTNDEDGSISTVVIS